MAHHTSGALVAPPARPRPAPVRALAAYADGSDVTLGWRAPASAVQHIVARYAHGSTPPATPRDGTAVVVSGPDATSATITGLAPDTSYAATVWTRTAGRLSHPATVTFVTDDRISGRTGTLTGVVSDRHGSPLSGVTVSADDYVGDTASTTTGADGRYTLTLPPDSYAIDYAGSDATGGDSDSTGYVGTSDYTAVPSGGTTVSNETLRDGGALTGTLAYAGGGPAAGVSVEQIPTQAYVGQVEHGNIMISIDNGVRYGTATSADDGTFTVRGAAPGPSLLCFGVSDDSASGNCTQVSTLAQPRRTLSVGAQNLPASASGALAGHVLAAGGAPLADTSVSVTRTGREYDYREATTDADGAFDIGSLPAGRYQVCADTSDGPSGADGLGYAGRCLRQPLRVVDGATTTRTVTLAVGAALSGSVRSTAGTPVSGAEILVEGSRRGYYGYGFATTDARGHWSVAGLATGDYRVCAQMEEARAKRMPTGLRNTCYDQHSKVHVTQGRRRIGVDLTTGAGGAISGRVLRSDGRPVRSVLVDAETMRGTGFGEAVTDADGHYRAVGMAPGTYRVCFDIVFVTGPDREKCVKDVQVRAGATTREVDVTYPAAGALEVSAVDTDGVPLAGADAAVLSPCTRVCSSPEPLGESAAVRASAVTDSRGSVLIRNLVPGKYWVCVFGYYAATSEGAPATGYADTCAARKVTITGHHRATSTLTLDVAGAVSGTVTDTSGDPIPGVHVEVSGSAEQDTATTDPFYVDGGPDAGATTGADGSYLVRSVVPGRQKVCFDATEATGTSAGGYESTCPDGVPGDANRVPVQVHTGAVTSGVDAELTPDGAITGRLTTSDGGRLGWFADAVAFSRGLEYDAIVGHKGNFTFDGLPAGKYRVCFQALHYRSQCYDDVPWSHRLPPENAKAIAVTAGDATTGIDATLVRR